MGECTEAVAAARAVLPASRTVHDYGWAAADGTVILVAPDSDPILRRLLGRASLVRVDPGGEVSSGTFLWFKDEIDTMSTFGPWPDDGH